MARTRSSKKKSLERISPKKLQGISKAKNTRAKNKQAKKEVFNTIKRNNKQNKGKKNNSNMQMIPADTLNISRGRQIKYADNNDNFNIKITCTTSNGSQETITKATNKRRSRKRTLGDDFITLDCVEENDDVILINDCDDSDVIFVDAKNSNTAVNNITNCDESVILIEDDSEIQSSTPKPAYKSITNTTIPSPIISSARQPVWRYFATSTPLNKKNTFPPSLFNHANELLRQQVPQRPTEVPENLWNLNKFDSNLRQQVPQRPTEVPENLWNLNKFGSNFRQQVPQRPPEVPGTLSNLRQQVPQRPPEVPENLSNLRQQVPQRPPEVPGTLSNLRQQVPQRLPEIPENLLNLNKFGSNFLNAGTVRTNGLRPIFIDGSNVAIRHSNNKFFSVKGLKICIDYFKLRGHEVTAIVPMYRKLHNQNSDSNLLLRLEEEGSIVFTPSRRINGRNIVPYDDRYIVLLAHVHKGIIVSSDNFRDLLQENPNLKDTIENRVLNPTWLKDMIIFPPDPLGRHGPKLDDFLKFP